MRQPSVTIGRGRRWMHGAALLIAMGGVAGVPAPGRAQDVSNGAKIFSRCAICHARSASGGSAVGPHLGGIVGRRAGSVSGYRYSTPMAKAGFAWDGPRLDAFMARPQAVVKGTRMSFAGITDPAARADLVAYLGTLR